MAPRTAKAKKNADVKVAEIEAPKKGRGKAKNISEKDQDSAEIVDEKIAVGEKKSKRGKNIPSENNEEQIIASNNEDVVPAKKGKKKNDEESVENGDNSEEEVAGSIDDENEDQSNGNSNDAEIPTKGRKKAVKKDTEKVVKPRESARTKKNTKQEVDTGNNGATEDKPKGRGRGRKAQPKPEPDHDENVSEEEGKPVTKGRKKALPKTQDKLAEKIEDVEMEEDDKEELVENNEKEDKVEDEPKKKEVKGRKNAKKALPKEDLEDKEEEVKEEAPAKIRKPAKKDDKGKGDTKDETEKDEVEDPKPAKGKRGQKKAEKPETEELQDTGEPVTKRRRKADDKVSEDSKKKPVKSGTDYDSIDFSNLSKNAQGKDWNFKISSWNVDGIRAWMGKEGLEYLKYEKPDILCLQEVKCSLDKLPEEIKNIPGYHAYWLCSEKDGYAGVGIYTTKLAMNVQYGLQNEELDSDGRIITAEYEHFYLICTYVPNAGRKLVTLPKRLKWNEEFRNHVKSLDKNKPVIICGDMNVAHNEIDLTNPKTNKKNAGFTEEERQGMTELLGDGFVDTYRHFYPDKTGAYTFWSYMSNSRPKNIGWRLDYFVVSERLLPAICDNVIRDKVYGSDHCPISLFLHLTTADKPKE
ncbi:unnamed protein product, partial [Brenthis ino]